MLEGLAEAYTSTQSVAADVSKSRNMRNVVGLTLEVSQVLVLVDNVTSILDAVERQATLSKH